ncbi:hypothetical protein Tco_0144175 [Tanacetum coccineum]
MGSVLSADDFVNEESISLADNIFNNKDSRDRSCVDAPYCNMQHISVTMDVKAPFECCKPEKDHISSSGNLSKRHKTHERPKSVCLCARFQEDPKTSHPEAVKRIFQYVKGTTHLGLWYHKGSGIETVVYVDSDHAGDYVDRKSTSSICTFIGCYLTSWFLKKQIALAISTTKAEYVSTEKTCQQALSMKQTLIDYGIRLNDIPIMYDNKGAIDLSKNPVQHSRTKHIEIRHHFLRDNVQ